MLYRHFRPIPQLAPYIECFWLIEASAESAVARRARMPADSRTTLLLSFAGQTRMIAGENTTHHVGIGGYVLGVHSQSYTLEHDGNTHLIAAQFHPGGFAPFVRDGTDELTEQTTPLDLLWGSTGNLLCEQIYEADSVTEQLALYQNALVKHLAEVPHQPRIQRALAQIDDAQGDVSVERLATQANLSQKQLERLFERVVGLMPKRYIRLARFQKLVTHLRHRGETASWAALAAQFGYYDHSHLVKDFQAFAGTAPSEFAAVTAGIVEVAYADQDRHQEV